VNSVLVSLLLACSDPPNGPDSGSAHGEPVTYYEHIRPIVERSCLGCHVDSGTGPFALDTYAQLYAVRELAREKVATRTMPPWFTSKDCATYPDDISLTDEEIALFEAWADQGGPEGDPWDEPKDTAPPDDSGLGLGRIDVTLPMEAPYSPTAIDEVHCFNLSWPVPETTFITGIRIDTSDDSIMHHVTIHSIEPAHAAAYAKLQDADADQGYVCADSSGANDEGTVELGGWTGGGKITKFPDGTGVKIEPGSLIQLQVHYTASAEELGTKSDLTTLMFSVDASAKQAYLDIVQDQAMLSMPVMVPANDPDVFLEADVPPLEFPKSFWVSGASFHMHYLGTGGGVFIKHPDGTMDCILDLTGWDPDWQQAYTLEPMKLFQEGDVWHLECRWDNSQENQPIIGGVQRETREIPWGTSLEDEMCRASVRLIDAAK
jgi:hypothetical protein